MNRGYRLLIFSFIFCFQLTANFTTIPAIKSRLDRYKENSEMYEIINKESRIISEKNYTYSDAVATILKENKIDERHLQKLNGYQMQHFIHQHIIYLLEHITRIPQSSCLYEYRNALVTCLEAAATYHLFDQRMALDIIDFCSATLLCCDKDMNKLSAAISYILKYPTKLNIEELMDHGTGISEFAECVDHIFFDLLDFSFCYRERMENLSDTILLLEIRSLLIEKMHAAYYYIKVNNDHSPYIIARYRLLRGLSNILDKTCIPLCDTQI